MFDVSSSPRKMPWREAQQQANLLAAMAEQQRRVAERIRRIRDDHALTQEEAASRLGVGLRAWQRWEAGVSEPYRSNIERLSQVFDVPVSEFYDDVVGNDDRLGRIEAKLDDLIEILGGRLDAQETAITELRAALLGDVAEGLLRTRERVSPGRGGTGRPERRAADRG